MANPTTSFGWVMPTSSSLVTNLPADFNTFGQAVDTSMQYLLGGTTGQVLSKTSGTNMAFTWVTPTDQTPLTTKGDLFTFTTVDARLAVGNNGETLVANSAASSGLTWQEPKASQPILNSAFQVWQRGTSGTGNANTATTNYLADRWLNYRGVAGSTYSRQVTGDTTNLPNIQYCMRVSRDSGNTSTSTMYLDQIMETVNSIPFAGKAVTLSFYARKGANYSATSSLLSAYLTTGTGTDQNINGTWTGAVNVVSGSATLTTTWQRFQYTGTIGATATQLDIEFQFVPTGTAGAADYYEVTGVQLEVGSVATPFKKFSATIQGELAACQRYYNRITPSTGAYEVLGSGYAISTTVTTITVPFPVSMRIKPTSAETTGTAANYAVLNGAGGVVACSVVPAIDSQNTNLTGLLSATVASGLTAGQGTQLRANNTTAAYIGWSAEL
jgi:hypothetical protein